MTDRRKGSGAKKGSAAKSHNLTQADYRRLAEFRYLLRKFLDFSETAAEQAGVTAQQHQALLAIKAHADVQPMTTGAFAERLCIRHHSAVGLLDRLVSKDLIRRRIGKGDRRQVLIELSPAAEDILRGLTVVHRQELRRLAPLLLSLLGNFDSARKQRASRKDKANLRRS
jgi:DNA-binding MarR family transcriptional regulator